MSPPGPDPAPVPARDGVGVLIVDDEALARDCVRLALARHPDVRIVADCGDGHQAVAAIRAHAPDLVFLDVQMPGLDGFAVVEEIGAAAMPPVVFVTAYDAHALEAFRVHALDYVLKPFDDARFDEALDHARAQVTLRRDGALGRRFASLLADVRQTVDPAMHAADGARRVTPATPVPITRLTVREGDRVHFVPVADVDYFEGAGNYVTLHVGSQTYRVRASLSSLVPRLDPARFARIHRSTIVNVERIREVQPWFGGDYIAFLRDGRQLRVSRTFAPELLRPVG